MKYPVCEFLGLGLRQSRAGEIETQPPQLLCLISVLDTRKARDQHALCDAAKVQIELPAAGFVL